jgi:hypothetical protein
MGGLLQSGSLFFEVRPFGGMQSSEKFQSNDSGCEVLFWCFDFVRPVLFVECEQRFALSPLL